MCPTYIQAPNRAQVALSRPTQTCQGQPIYVQGRTLDSRGLQVLWTIKNRWRRLSPWDRQIERLTCCQTMGTAVSGLSSSDHNERKNQLSSKWCTVLSQTEKTILESPHMTLWGSPAPTAVGYLLPKTAFSFCRLYFCPHISLIIEPADSQGKWTKFLDVYTAAISVEVEQVRVQHFCPFVLT